MSGTETKKIIRYKDLFIGDFWRYFVKAAWIYFPAILFIILAYVIFWKLSQGKDLMIITLENRKVIGLFLLALVFWVLITWYTSRLVAKAKEFLDSDRHLMWSTLRIQGPRILAFTCFTVIILAFFQLPYPETPKLSQTAASVIFWLSFSWYFVVYQFWNRFLDTAKGTVREKIMFWQKIRLITYIFIFLATAFVVFNKWIGGLIILLLCYQVSFVIIILIRRNIIDAKNEYSFQNRDRYQTGVKGISVWKKFRQLVTDKEDKRYFQAITLISILAVIVYFATIISVRFSTWIGSFPFLLLAFGVLLGIGNLIAMFSVLLRFNFHLLFVTIAFLLGYVSEPHYTRLSKKENTANQFSNRQDLKEYFYGWLSDPARRQILTDSSVKKFPVYFVMANGGASRSGYWAASVLSKIEDETKGAFSRHLFSLSGASGGSVGNAAFFSALREKEKLQKADTSAYPLLNASKNFLKSDFLTYTIARTLGPDVFRNLITLYKVHDRASALSFALENAAGEKSPLNGSFAVPFSEIITQKGNPYSLPVLCINTTRMQDGSPGIISNIKITDTIFNNRIDVLSLLDETKDMRLSTGVVLGASFPYLSPAGRLDHKSCDTCFIEPHYFVDGGYFDNSGAGPVFEMIFSINQYLEAEELKPFKDKLEFYILHIINDPLTPSRITKVNPFINDLAAPVKTLVGAYGTQTSVNDTRLNKYIRSLYEDNEHYRYISLYKEQDSMRYTMSWVISKYVLDAMDRRLNSSSELDTLIKSMNQQLR